MNSDPANGNSRSYNPSPSRNVPAREKHSAANTPRRLSWEELKRKRSLVLYFSCDERYTPGHKCQQPQLFIIEGAHDDDNDPIFDTHEGDTEEITPEITLHALPCWDSPQTLRILATIKNTEMVVLVNSGSTHNFISEKFARSLNLTPTPVKPFAMKVVNGQPLRCITRYYSIKITMGGAHFTVTLYGLPLVGLDLVLGIEWLEKLGPTLCEWKSRTMKFLWADIPITLCGLNIHQFRQ